MPPVGLPNQMPEEVEEKILLKAFEILNRYIETRKRGNPTEWVFMLKDTRDKPYVHIYWRDAGIEHQVEIHHTHISVIF